MCVSIARNVSHSGKLPRKLNVAAKFKISLRICMVSNATNAPCWPCNCQTTTFAAKGPWKMANVIVVMVVMVVLCRISAAASLSSTANNFRMAFRETMVVSRVHRLLLLSVVVSMVTTLIRADSRQLRDLPAADAMVSAQCCNKLLR